MFSMGIMKWATDGRINSIQVQLILLVDYIVYKSLQKCSAGRALNFSLRDTLEHIWRSLGERPTEMSSPKLGVEIISTLLTCNVKECESSVCTPVEEENERNGVFKEGLRGEAPLWEGTATGKGTPIAQPGRWSPWPGSSWGCPRGLRGDSQQ